MRNLPPHRTAQSKVWLEIVQLALDPLVWMPMLALTGKARLREARRLRLRLFSDGRTTCHHRPPADLRLAGHWPWTAYITAALERLALLPNPC
ncbi:transposase [Streptomyces sp. NPDC058459]|uniref:transposase n=1 Tax=Streptomyces sp. NPDC058459 TaxID=3346508 RepID=UPI003664DB3C